MNKFEILDETVKKIGISPREAILYWLREQKISIGTLRLLDTNAKMNDDVFSCLRVGWYFFANGKFSPNPDTYPNPIGVVAWLKPELNAPKGDRGIILFFDEFYGKWSENMYREIGASDVYDGMENTQKLWKYRKQNNISFPIAEFCKGCYEGAFIPAYKQLYKIANSYETVNEAFQAVGKKFHPFLLSSTEVNEKQVVCMDMRTAKITEVVKTSFVYAYPIMML